MRCFRGCWQDRRTGIASPARRPETTAARRSLPAGDDVKRLGAADGPIDRQFAKIRFPPDRLVEQRGIAAARDLERAETAQMLGHILRIEQLEAARDASKVALVHLVARLIAGAVEH